MWSRLCVPCQLLQEKVSVIASPEKRPVASSSGLTSFALRSARMAHCVHKIGEETIRCLDGSRRHPLALRDNDRVIWHDIRAESHTRRRIHHVIQWRR